MTKKREVEVIGRSTCKKGKKREEREERGWDNAMLPGSKLKGTIKVPDNMHL